MIYYTTNTKFGAPQNLSFNSLGGFMSSSRVPNGAVNNIFSSLSLEELKKDSFRISGLIFKNETQSPISNLKFFFDKIHSSPFFKYKIGFSSVTISANKEKSIELLSNRQSLPYSVSEFIEATELDPAELQYTIPIDGYLGVWLKRDFDKSLYDTYCSDEALEARFKNGESEKNEEIILKISFDDRSIFDEPFDKPFE